MGSHARVRGDDLKFRKYHMQDRAHTYIPQLHAMIHQMCQYAIGTVDSQVSRLQLGILCAGGSTEHEGHIKAICSDTFRGTSNSSDTPTWS